MIKTPTVFPLVYKQRFVKNSYPNTRIEVKPCHNISQLQGLSAKCEIYGCSIFIRFLFVLFIHKARFVAETKGESASISYFSLVSAFVLVALGRRYK